MLVTGRQPLVLLDPVVDMALRVQESGGTVFDLSQAATLAERQLLGAWHEVDDQLALALLGVDPAGDGPVDAVLQLRKLDLPGVQICSGWPYGWITRPIPMRSVCLLPTAATAPTRPECDRWNVGQLRAAAGQALTSAVIRST